MLRGRTYEEVCNNFKWEIPKYYNIGVDVCDKWADDKNRLALIYVNPHGIDGKYTFRELRNISNRLANALKAHGITRKDRVGILLSQRPETLISHIAVYKLGAIAVQLLTLFGPDAIEFRLQDRTGRSGRLFDEACGRCPGRGHRCSRPDQRRNRQSVYSTERGDETR